MKLFLGVLSGLVVLVIAVAATESTDLNEDLDDSVIVEGECYVVIRFSTLKIIIVKTTNYA